MTSDPGITEALAVALSRLGLTVDADARAVRQAYARELKQIDQASDIQGFQSLREAYALALDAVQRGRGEAAPTAALPPIAPLDKIDSPAPATASFDDLASGLGTIASTEAAAALLRQAQQNLPSLEAGMLLERRVVELLGSGWQPGHEFLLDAACDNFNWTQDLQHLRSFGPAGELLQEALIERQVLLDQPDGVLRRQLKLAHRLRDATPPSPTLLRDEQLMVRILIRRFPHWLGMVTSMAHIEQWLGGPEAVQAALAMPDPSQAAESASRGFSVSQAILLMLWLGWMLWRYYG